MSIPLRVLLVAGAEDSAARILHGLTEGGYDVASSRVDTAEAMRDALQRSAWDIILADHDTPRLGGPEALRVREEQGSLVPFILVSGSIGETLAVAIMRSGAYDCIPRDDLALLAPAVERALRGARGLQERKRAVAALRESEERYALIIEASRDGLWDWNILENKSYLSPRYKGMIGYEEHEITSYDDFRKLILDEDVGRADKAMYDHLQHRTPYDVEFRVRTKQGEIRWFNGRGQALWDPQGRPTRMAGSMTDITARKRTEEALRQQLELIREQQEAIRALSTPLIEVWDGVLTIPVLGTLDEKRSAEMMESLLAGVTRARARHVIIDLTGVSAMDAPTAGHLMRIVSALRLLGARGIAVGIQPEVAQAIVSIGVDLASITTLATLRDALVFCMRQAAS